jgi:hypothetical protein
MRERARSTGQSEYRCDLFHEVKKLSRLVNIARSHIKEMDPMARIMTIAVLLACAAMRAEEGTSEKMADGDQLREGGNGITQRNRETENSTESGARQRAGDAGRARNDKTAGHANDKRLPEVCVSGGLVAA